VQILTIRQVGTGIHACHVYNPVLVRWMPYSWLALVYLLNSMIFDKLAVYIDSM